jgi:hypothetical protein
MRIPFFQRTEDELRELAIEIAWLAHAACAGEPESEHDAFAEAAVLMVNRRERLRPTEQRRLAQHLADYAGLNLQRVLMVQEPAGQA